MNKELVHLSTCARDHTAPNCHQSRLDLHIDVKAQSEVSIATITMEQQPDLFDCEPPVIIQCSPVSLDPHIDQTDLHVPSPTSCAHYSYIAHVTMHPDRDVSSRILFRPANSRYTNHLVLNALPQHQLELNVKLLDRAGKSKMAHYTSFIIEINKRQQTYHTHTKYTIYIEKRRERHKQYNINYS